MILIISKDLQGSYLQAKDPGRCLDRPCRFLSVKDLRRILKEPLSWLAGYPWLMKFFILHIDSWSRKLHDQGHLCLVLNFAMWAFWYRKKLAGKFRLNPWLGWSGFEELEPGGFCCVSHQRIICQHVHIHMHYWMQCCIHNQQHICAWMCLCLCVCLSVCMCAWVCVHACVHFYVYSIICTAPSVSVLCHCRLAPLVTEMWRRGSER